MYMWGGMECDCICGVVGDVLVWNNVMWSVDLHSGVVCMF